MSAKKETKAKLLKELDIVFENCEVFAVPADCIHRAYFGEVTRNLTVNYNGLGSNCTEVGAILDSCYSNDIDIILSKKGMEILGGFDEKTILKDRLKHNDITHIDLIFTDGSNQYICTPWGGDDEYFNAAMHVYATDDLIDIHINEKINVAKDNEEFVEYAKIQKKREERKAETPEIGHLLYGTNTIYDHSVPNYIHAALLMIKSRLDTIMWNKEQKEYDSPFENSGNDFKNEVFEVCAYDWDTDKKQEFNFKWNDYKLSWYKYLGRDMSANRYLSEKECAQMLDECLESLKFKED